MAASITRCPQMAEIAEKVIQQHEDLHWILESGLRIGYRMSDQAKTKDGGSQFVEGECHKCNPLERSLEAEYDFVIIFYQPNIEYMTAEQLEILMYHELLHVGLTAGGDPKINPHDYVINDFRAVIEKHGVDWDKPDESVTPVDIPDEYEAGEIDPDDRDNALPVRCVR